ncbi:MAG: PilT/PilU family type 4a pilus ATPase [Victivallales bacterium]|nr:PilT/PilU family type 4a pilus ATPase [Victivallales bacterium]
MKKESISKEIEWFCTQAVTEGLLTRESCVMVIEAIEENNLAVELNIFVQVVKDNQLCKQPDKLDACIQKAREMAKFFPGPPANSVFADLADAAPAPQPAAAPASPAPSAVPRNVASPDWTQGWPRLADAEGMSRDSARELLNAFLHKAREVGCSDVHISAGAVPFVRRYKFLQLLTEQGVISAKAAENLNLSALNEERLTRFEKNHDLDYGYNISESDRYRTNVELHRLGISGSYRVIDTHIKRIDELGFPDPSIIEKLTSYNQGLILVAGPAGSGKSTTLAAMVDHINRTRRDHIVTVEDPIEVVFHPNKCNITQRELGTHTRSFANALRASLREDPDIIVIGEMRDLETVEMAVHASETGHLVIGTLHTNSAPETMNRILDMFPVNQQSQIRAMVSESLKAVLCQQLVSNKEENGVVMVPEILLGTLAVSNLIREGKTFQLESTMQTSKNIGMITMEQSHFDLYMAGKRSYAQTEPLIRNRDLLRQMQANEAGLGQSAAADSAAAAPKKKRGWF